jgi:hypothetical protein
VLSPDSEHVTETPWRCRHGGTIRIVIACVTKPSFAAGLIPRAAVTAGAVVLFLVAERVPLPFLDWNEVRLLTRDARLPVLKLLGVGLSPFFLAYFLVECLAAAHPRLRTLRHGSAVERAPLTVAAWALALAVAAAQAWSIATYLQALRGSHGEPLLAPGAANLLGVTSTLVLGTAFAGWAALMVSRHGVGNGFAVLFAAVAAEDLLHFAAFSARLLNGAWTDVHLLVGLALVVVVPLVLVHQLRHRGASPHVPVPTCGLAPLQLAPLLLLLPYTLIGWFGPSRLADELWPGRDAFACAAIALATGLGLILARVFCPADAVVGAFRRAATGPFDEGAAAAVRRALSIANRRSWAVVICMATLPVAASLPGASVPLGTDDLLSLGIVIAVAWDLGAELRARTASALVAARPLHRVYAVEPVLEALQAAGIQGFARARRYRSLFHFFAPYAPIEILVPPERAAEADAICATIAADRTAA